MGWAPARVPHRELWVIAELVRVRSIYLECVKEPAAADGIVGLGHADALPEGVAWESGPQGKVAYQPAICDRIIESKRVSLIIEGARSARQPRKE